MKDRRKWKFERASKKEMIQKNKMRGGEVKDLLTTFPKRKKKK
jgi:hypothetical protein